ncbi:MAG: hypothetical protein ACXWG8_07770 [Usitatibacter sp.]
MFGPRIHLHGHGPKTVYHHETVHEHRAPTDESVRLLKEMERAARDKIVETIRIEGNGFNCIVHRSENYLDLDDTVAFVVIYDINGVRRRVDHREPTKRSTENRIDWQARLIDNLIKAVGEDIALNILRGSLGKALRA